MEVFVIELYSLSGVNSEGTRYYRFDGQSEIFISSKLAIEYLNGEGYYRNQSMHIGNSGRFINSMDTAKYALIHKRKVHQDTQDILKLKERLL